MLTSLREHTSVAAPLQAFQSGAAASSLLNELGKAWVDRLITHGNSETRASVHAVIDTGPSTVGEPAAYLPNNLAALSSGVEIRPSSVASAAQTLPGRSALPLRFQTLP